MSWEQRLREMILAGGALAITACGGSTAAPGTSGSGDNSQFGGDGGDATGGDPTAGSSSAGVCCNADPDPCCTCMGEITEADPESACGHELACQAAGGTWNPYDNSYNGVITPPHCEFEASDETDAALESARASSLQCGGGTISGTGTDPCINAGGVCVQLPDPACCDLVPGFDPTNSGCPHAPFAIRCCALDAGASDAADASAE
jgi:hypothetical protein